MTRKVGRSMVYPQALRALYVGRGGGGDAGERLPPTRPWDVHVPEMAPWSGRQDSPPVMTFLLSHPGACSRPSDRPKAEEGLGGGFLVTLPHSSLSRAVPGRAEGS